LTLQNPGTTNIRHSGVVRGDFRPPDPCGAFGGTGGLNQLNVDGSIRNAYDTTLSKGGALTVTLGYEGMQSNSAIRAHRFAGRMPIPSFVQKTQAFRKFKTQRRKSMSEASRIKYLPTALLMVGLIFVVGIYPLTILWPSGWSWHTGQSHYLQMILGIYATLGAFLLVASRKPLAHLSLIWFTVWSSVVHAAIMAVQSVANPEHMGHLWGDVLALFVAAGLLAFVTPRSVTEISTSAGSSGAL
jgi:hypothetical protein